MADPFVFLGAPTLANQFRGYTQVFSTEPTDAILMNRSNVGTVYIEVQDFLPTQSQVYDIAFGTPGVPTANAVVLVFNAVRPYTLPQALTGSQFSLQTPPTGNAMTLIIQKNNTDVGSIVFQESNTIGSASFYSSAQSFVAGDELKIFSPTPPNDLTVGRTLSITFEATLS